MLLYPKFSRKKNPKKRNRPRKHKKQKHHKYESSSEVHENHDRTKLPELEDQDDIELENTSRENKVEFVYPRDPKTGKSRKFLFKSRVKTENSSRNEDDSSFQSKDKTSISVVTSSETLDEILSVGGDKNTNGPLPLHDPEVHANKNTRSLIERKLSGVSVEDAVKDKTGCRPRANSTDGELRLPRRGLCDEGMVLQSHKWTTQYHQITPKGFINLGNTCFLNATLQCLAYLPPLCQSVALLDSCSGKISHGQRITQNLRQLFRQVHNLHNQKLNPCDEGAIAPRNIVNSVPTLGNIGSRNGYKFRPGRQEDAHEFLVHLLDAMQDGELRAAGINQHARGWRDNLPIPRLDETTLVHRIFGGYLRSQVKCTKCGYCSNTYDPFLDLALEVSKKSSTSIASAFKEYSRKETLDKNNQWRCSGCRKSVCATKQLTVFRPPLALCIQLKRFTYTNSFGLGSFSGYSKGMKFGGFGSGSKISKSIEFPACLRLPLSDGRKCEYALTGIVVHLGSSATSGHYTSFVKRPGHDNSGKWYHMDDSYVEAVSEKTVLRQKDVYLLFYCRVEVKLELPSPPSQPSMTTEQAKKLNVTRSKVRRESFEKPSKAPIVKIKASNSCSMDTITNESVDTKVEAKESTNDVSTHKNSISKLVDNEDNKITKSNLPQESRFSSKSSELRSIHNSTPQENQFKEFDVAKEDKVGKEDKIIAKKTEIIATKDAKTKTKVVVPRGDSNAKLELMIGPRFKSKKSWTPKTTFARSSNIELGLLGTQTVSKWEDDDADDLAPVGSKREELVADMAKQENIRKKKMHLDRWDSYLDQGKKKKVKDKKNASTHDTNNEPKANQFHRIQLGIQKMNRGRAKGFSRQSGKTRIHSKVKKSKASFKVKRR